MKLRKLLLLGAVLIGSPIAAWAGGQFTNQLPAASTITPFTGNETLPLDTNFSQGRQPQTVSATMAEVGAYSGSFNSGFRNVLICGDAGNCPWIRGTAAATIGDISTTMTYGADRWAAIGTAGAAINMSRQAVTDLDGSAFSMRFARKDTNADTDLVCMGQAMESTSSYRFKGRTAVLSFYAKAPSTWSSAQKALTVVVATGTGTDGTSVNLLTSDGSAVSATTGNWTGYSSPATVASTTSGGYTTKTITTAWVKYTFAVPVLSTANQIGVKFCWTPVGTASSDYVDFAQVQLEATDQDFSTAVASGFEFTSTQDMTVRAERHAWVLTEPAADVCQGAGYSTATTAARIVIANPVIMRAAPTVSSIGATLANTTWKVEDAATPIVLATPFLATFTANTVTNITLTATTAASQTVGRGVLLCGAGGGGILLASADL